MLHFKNICAIIIVAIAQNLLLRINSVLSALRLFFMCNARAQKIRRSFFVYGKKLAVLTPQTAIFALAAGKSRFCGPFQARTARRLRSDKNCQFKRSGFCKGYTPLCCVLFRTQHTIKTFLNKKFL